MPRQTQNICFTAARVSAAEAGDIYQITLSQSDDEMDFEKPYVMIGRNFEFPDRGRCTIETERPELCGSYRMKLAHLDGLGFTFVTEYPFLSGTINIADPEFDPVAFVNVLRAIHPDAIVS